MPKTFTFSGSSFAVDSRAPDGDGFVIREGKVFELGSWADKGFSLDESEADAAIAAFTPPSNDLEHRSTILDGKLGTLESIRRNGSEIIGRVRIPKWLDAIQGDKPIGVSLAWDAAKKVVGNALTLNPRITDAQVVAAFTADADFEALDAYEFFIEFVGKRNSAADSKDIQAVHDLTAKLGAECKAREEKAKEADIKYTADPPGKEKPKMTIRAFLTSLGFSDKPNLDAEFTAPTVTPVVPPAATPTAPAQPSAEFTAQMTAMQGEIKVARESALMTAAKAFCAELRAAKKIVPAQEPQIITAFCMNAKDDAKDQPGYIEGLACFNAEGALIEGPRVAALRGQYQAAPALTYTEELLDASDASVLFANGGQAPMDPAKLKSYLGMSELGKSALKEVAKS